MKHTFGAVFACLAIVGVSACGEASPPPAEGNALVQNMSSGVSRSIGGSSGPADFGTTVLDGTEGVRVTCSVKRSGGSFSISGHIQSPEMTMDISSSDVAAGAYMSFFVQASTLDSENSVDASNNSAPSCTLTVSQAGTKYILKPGSIYAGYDCPTVRPQSNLTIHHWSGRFLFTGCEK